MGTFLVDCFSRNGNCRISRKPSSSFVMLLTRVFKVGISPEAFVCGNGKER